MEYFTSDWHLGETRIGPSVESNLFYRPFNSVEDQDSCIIKNFRNTFKDGDTLWHLGDVIVSGPNIKNSFSILQTLKKDYPNSKFNLILGNHDLDKLDDLSKYFTTTCIDYIWSNYQSELSIYLNHYPVKCVEMLQKKSDLDFAITGHIHSLWKIQKKMINVGVDAWHFRLVSTQEILFCWKAMQKYYDNNVFPY